MDEFRPEDVDDIEARFQQIEREFGEASRDQDIYLEELNNAVQAALEADGFFLLTVHNMKVEGMEIWVPAFFASTTTPGAIHVLRAQIIQTASASLQSYVKGILKNLREEKE